MNINCGRFCFSFMPTYWAWGYHGAPCCYFFVEVGPFAVWCVR
jgi:hypothetical protein